MDFEFTEAISHPRERVYELLKNGLTDLVPLVPNVIQVSELSREQIGPGEENIVNEWHGDPGSAPRLLRPFIRPEMQIWRDYAHWVDHEYLVHWRFEAPSFANFYECGGTNYVEEDGSGGTIVRLTGTLVTHPERIRGVPKGLARKLAPTVEKWLINLVSPNLSELPKAVQQFLDQE